MKIFFPSGAFDELETNDLMWMNYTSQETNATWTHILDENNSTELETNDFIWMNDTSQEKNATSTFKVCVCVGVTNIYLFEAKMIV